MPALRRPAATYGLQPIGGRVRRSELRYDRAMRAIVLAAVGLTLASEAAAQSHGFFGDIYLPPLRCPPNDANLQAMFAEQGNRCVCLPVIRRAPVSREQRRFIDPGSRG
jgi:hypothetical protein